MVCPFIDKELKGCSDVLNMQHIDQAMRRFHHENAPEPPALDGRIDRLHDRMVDLEQMLDRFLEEIESSRRSNRDR